MDDLLLHAKSAAVIKEFTKEAVHALLLSGPEGAGKFTTAQHVAKKVLGLKATADLSAYPYFSWVRPTNNVISIQEIRDMQRFLQLRTTGKAKIRRIIIISDAHTMTIEAQNALLKSLEEPPADTILILTTTSAGDLRPTVRSRAQQIEILPVSKSAAEQYYRQQGHRTEKIEKAYAISAGCAGLMSALLNDEESHELFQIIVFVKELLVKAPFERLVEVDALAKQKDRLGSLLQGCRLVCSAALVQASTKNESRLIARWTQSLQSIYDTEAGLSANPNQKLLLTNLMLNL